MQEHAVWEHPSQRHGRTTWHIQASQSHPNMTSSWPTMTQLQHTTGFVDNMLHQVMTYLAHGIVFFLLGLYI